jgi:hypothetical protein
VSRSELGSAQLIMHFGRAGSLVEHNCSDGRRHVSLFVPPHHRNSYAFNSLCSRHSTTIGRNANLTAHHVCLSRFSANLRRDVKNAYCPRSEIYQEALVVHQWRKKEQRPEPPSSAIIHHQLVKVLGISISGEVDHHGSASLKFGVAP